MRVAVVLGCLGATAVQAQNLKVDSLRVELSWPADQVDDSVKAAFSRAGLTITRTTPSLIEAKESGTAGMGGGQIQRVVRASIYSGERISSVQIVGEEIVRDRNGWTVRRRRIDNRARGDTGEVWKKMVAAARMLDSTSVPDQATAHP